MNLIISLNYCTLFTVSKYLELVQIVVSYFDQTYSVRIGLHTHTNKNEQITLSVDAGGDGERESRNEN